MHHRGGGIGHTTAHNVKDANCVPSDLFCKIGLQNVRGVGESDMMDLDLQSTEEMLRRDQENEDNEDIELVGCESEETDGAGDNVDLDDDDSEDDNDDGNRSDATSIANWND